MTVKLSVRKSGWWEFVKPLRECESFVTAGALKGSKAPICEVPTMGQLPTEYRDLLKEASSCEILEYVVWSYLTPIAWKIDGEWMQPAIYYSVTTTRHQNLIATALSKVYDSSYT